MQGTPSPKYGAQPPRYDPYQGPATGPAQPWHTHNTGVTRRRRRSTVIIVPLVITSVAVVTGLIVVPRLREKDPVQPLASATPPQTGALRADPPTTTIATDEPEEPKSEYLLTPAAIRKVIAAMEKASGGKVFTDFSVHEEHASAKAPVPGKKAILDAFTYRDGEVERTPGGTMSSFTRAIKLTQFNWDALPALIKTADRKLGIDKPKYRYVVVQTAWPFAGKPQPVMSVYLADDHGGAYLAANTQGKILKMYPRGE